MDCFKNNNFIHELIMFYFKFWQNVTFEGFPPLYVQCLRGQVLAVTSDCVMLWAMDTGLIGFSSIRYIHHIASTETLAQPALIKICELEGKFN